MAFQGQVLSVEQMLDHARMDPGVLDGVRVGVRHTAADNAARCRNLLATGASLDDCWRFVVLQTLDDYTSTLRRGGPDLGARVFTVEPPPTGAVEVDAALAALAQYLAQRDGWYPPIWTTDPARSLIEPWYPAVPPMWREEAEQDSPPAFGDRGIFITSRSLARA